MDTSDLDRRIDQVAALGERVRRTLYQYVAGETEPVSREQAATALAIPLHVAKFHLDRLEADGLLTASYRRPPGRRGPGAGRPAKVYRAAGEVQVSVPERRYDLAGRLLVRALGTAARTGAAVEDALADIARAAGRDVALETERPVRTSAARAACAVLEACGYQPAGSREITLQNCPFHLLADEDRPLVCTMNLAFVSGVLDGVGATDAEARLDPVAGGCCVRITRPARRRLRS